MRKNRGKIVLIVATVLLSLYFLYPTYENFEIAKQLKGLAGDDSAKFVEDHQNEIREVREKRLKLGLDLQGGMRVVLEVNVLKLLEDLAGNRKDSTFNRIIEEVRAEARTSDESLLSIFRRKFENQGIRLSRYYGSIRDTDDDI
ncbi:MAG TPA: protein translocase subunit SecD, partial [Bacteroidota bacterium]